MEKENRDLKKTFSTTYNTATAGAITCFLSLVITAVSLKLWLETEVELYRIIGLASLGVAFVSITAGFLSQSVNQYVQYDARKRGKGPNFFRECQGPSLIGQIAGHFTTGRSVTSAKIIRHRLNARSYRRAPRPMFAHVQHSSRASKYSGDSDSGDPPEPLPTAPQISFTANSSRQSLTNSTSIFQRNALAVGFCPAAYFRSREVI